MTDLGSLLLPILVSAVAVFIASSIIHMLLGYHAADYGKVASEDKVLDALRPFGIAPGDYMFPAPSGSNPMKSVHMARLRPETEMVARLARAIRT